MEIYNPKVQTCSVNCENNSIFIEGYINNQNKVMLLIEERIKLHDLRIPNQIKITAEVLSGFFSVDINTEVYKDILSKGTDWDLYFVDMITGLRSKVICESSLIINNDECIIPDTFKKVKISIARNNTINLKINDILGLKADIVDLTDDEQYTTINASVNLGALMDCNLEVVIRKRNRKDLLIYENEINCSVNFIDIDSKTLQFVFDKNMLINVGEIHTEDTWDFFLKLRDGVNNINYAPLNIDKKILNNYEDPNLNDLYSTKYFSTKKGTLALWIDQASAIKVQCRSISWDKGNLHISIEKNNKVELIDMYINLRGENIYSRLKSYKIKIPFYKKNNIYSCDFNLEQILDFPLRDKIVWDIFYTMKNQEGQTGDFALSINDFDTNKFNYYRVNNCYLIKPFLTKKSTLAMYIKKSIEKNEDSIKLAILGSCYSRNAFNSAAYYNPFYKEKYSVEYSLFHSSLPSIMSNPIPFNINDFRHDNIGNTELGYIQDDFEKNFFGKLSSANAQFLIIDLYADAVRDLIVFDKDRLITGTYMIRNAKDFIASLTGKAEIITHNQSDKFIELWVPAAERFAKEIIKYIPQERIIINKCKMAKKYYDKNKNVIDFRAEKELIIRSNDFFDFMENYLIGLLPKAHVIDISDNKFIASEDHPQGLSPNHYETGYYKEFLCRVDEVVVKSFYK